MKPWQAGLVLLSGVLLAGCSDNRSQGEKSEAPTALPQTESAASNAITSITDAMGLGKTMQCTYKTGEGAQAFESSVTVEGKKFKSSSLANGVQSYALSDGETIYIWSGANAEGMKMTQACLQDLQEKLPAGSASQMPENPEESFKMAKDVSCKEVGSVDFSVPTNVTFADQCALMRQSLEMMKNLPSVPQGYGR